MQINRVNKQNKKMDASKIKKFDDNTLFRYLAKSYSNRNKTITFLDSINQTKNSSHVFKTKITGKKARSQSSSIYDTLSRSQNIEQKNKAPKPGFLKYRKFSINQFIPLNSSISSSNKSLNKFQTYKKTIAEKNFTQFKSTLKDFRQNQEGTQTFGLRNVVKSVQNQFRPEDNETSLLKSDEEMLCAKSRKLLLGQKTYNLNGFLIAQNIRKFKNERKSIISNTIKTSIFRKKLKKTQQKQTICTIT